MPTSTRATATRTGAALHELRTGSTRSTSSFTAGARGGVSSARSSRTWAGRRPRVRRSFSPITGSANRCTHSARAVTAPGSMSVSAGSILTALGWTTTGDAHHEDLVMFPPCGHAVDESGPEGSGFDQARDELRARFTVAGHATSVVWWGNTQSFRQCDGDYAGSDGWAVFIELHQVNHS